MEQGGRIYEGDATRIARQLLDALERDKKSEGALFKMPSEGFPSGANLPDVNTGGQGSGGGDTNEPTRYALIPAGGAETITFKDSDTYGSFDLYFHYFRGDELTTSIYGGGHLFVLHNGSVVLRCDLLETSGPLAGFDGVADPPHGFSAALMGGDLVLSITMDSSDAEDTAFFAKAVYRSRA